MFIFFPTCFGQLCAHRQEKIPYLCNTWNLSLYVDDSLVCRAEFRPAYRTGSQILSVHTAFNIRETAIKYINCKERLWESGVLQSCSVPLFCCNYYLILHDTCSRMFQKPPIAKCTSSPGTCHLYESGSLTIGHTWRCGV